MAANKVVESLLAQQGIGLIETKVGKAALTALLQGDRVQTIYVPIDWNKISLVRSVQSLWEQLITVPSSDQRSLERDAFEKASADFAEKFMCMDYQGQKGFIQSLICDQLEVIAGIEAKNVSLRLGFMEMGLDSLMATEMHRRLQKLLDIELVTTLLFDYPTIEKLSEHLLNQLRNKQNTESGHLSEEEMQKLVKLLEEEV